MKGGSLSYRPRLDGLRSVAIGVVLIHHFGGYLASFCDLGYYGVDLFFVISGYLITGILLHAPPLPFGANYRTFMGRRILRIFPIYYLVVLLLAAFAVEPARELFGWLMTYTFNYGAVIHEQPGRDNNLFYLWSLSLEEQFYLLWPPVVLVLRGRPRMLAVVTLVIVAISYLQLNIGLAPAMSRFNYTGLLNRMGSLGMGALGAIYVWRRSLPNGVFRSLAAEVAVLILLGVAVAWPFPFHTVLMAGCSLFLVLKAAHFEFRIRPLDGFLNHRWIVYVGGISYGIYLFHVPIGWMLLDRMVIPFWQAIPFDSFGPLKVLRWHSWILKLPLYSAVTIAVAAASFKWCESPILALKDRWFSYRPVDALSAPRSL